jgi:hypothetical protein
MVSVVLKSTAFKGLSMCFSHLLANGELEPAKLHHLQTKHPELKSKSTEYFERQSTGLKGQQKELKATFGKILCIIIDIPFYNNTINWRVLMLLDDVREK